MSSYLTKGREGGNSWEAEFNCVMILLIMKSDRGIPNLNIYFSHETLGSKVAFKHVIEQLVKPLLTYNIS